MEKATVSKGHIAIPKAVRGALNLSEGARLTVEVRGQEIILSKEPAWKKLRGAAGGGHSLDPPNPPTVAEVDAFNRMIRELRNQGPSFAAAEK